MVAYLVCDIIVENLPKIPQRRSNSKSKTAIAFKDKQTTKRLMVQNLQEVHTYVLRMAVDIYGTS